MEEKITELESRIAFQDDTIQKLNEVIIEQQNQIDNLTAKVELLLEQLRELTPHLLASESEETPPPHY